MKIHIKILYKPIPSFSVAIARHAQNTRNSKFSRSSQYLKKGARDEADFCADNMEIFYKFILLNFVGVTRHAKRTQNNKYAISLLQYFKKEMSYEFDCFHANQACNIFAISQERS